MAANVDLYVREGDALVNVKVSSDWALISNKPATYTPTAHLHKTTDISDASISGKNLLKIEHTTSGVRFVRVNADGTVTLRSANDLRTDMSLNSVPNYPVATQAEAEAGTVANKLMTPQRVAQAIAKLATGGSSTPTVTLLGSGTNGSISLSNALNYNELYIVVEHYEDVYTIRETATVKKIGNAFANITPVFFYNPFDIMYNYVTVKSITNTSCTLETVMLSAPTIYVYGVK